MKTKPQLEFDDIRKMADAARKLKAQRRVTQTVWSGLGMIGMVGWSVALTVGLASLLSAILFYITCRPYRTHYARMHASS